MKLATGVYKEERECISGLLEAARDHSNTIETFREDHSGQAVSIENKAQETFLNQYMVGFSVILPSRIEKTKPRTTKKVLLIFHFRRKRFCCKILLLTCDVDNL